MPRQYQTTLGNPSRPYVAVPHGRVLAPLPGTLRCTIIPRLVLPTVDPDAVRVMAQDMFVPEAYATRSLTEPPECPWPLYRSLAFNQAIFAAAALGIARNTLDAFAELAAAKALSRAEGQLHDLPRAQGDLGRAEAGVRSARLPLCVGGGVLGGGVSRRAAAADGPR